MILVATALGGDEEIVALTILGEARGEGTQGMYAVACVIQERSEKKKLTQPRFAYRSGSSVFGMEKRKKTFKTFGNRSLLHLLNNWPMLFVMGGSSPKTIPEAQIIITHQTKRLHPTGFIKTSRKL